MNCRSRAIYPVLLAALGCAEGPAGSADGERAAVVSEGLSAPVGGLADPGVLRVGDRFVALSTGRLGVASFSDHGAAGPWQTANQVLTRPPAWASAHNLSLWAPSVIQVGHQFVAFYAALRKSTPGHDYEAANTRCIGTGVADNPLGPFVPRAEPLVCPDDNKAPDQVEGRPLTRWDVGVIDATPRYLELNGTRALYLTYKTQQIPSSIRMVRLDTTRGAASILGRSHELTRNLTKCEENPVIVQRGDTFTLFTSQGDFLTCDYQTVWRSSKHLWSWPAQSTPLHFPQGAHTCGTGDADVAAGLPHGSWRIFFSAHYPKVADPFQLYVGALSWSGNTPTVTTLLQPAH